MKTRVARVFAVLTLLCAAGRGAEYPKPLEGDFALRDFRFESGETLPELRIHYATLGQPARDRSGVVRNAVLILHGTTGSSRQFFTDAFAGVLFGPGQLLDASRYYLILPDGIGTGRSSRPSDGLRARFPHYGYRDMVEAQYRLLTEGLGVNHLRLVMGTSMGGMHTWLWGGTHPDFMDALLPLACLPAEIAGRNRMMRRMIIDAIRDDPEWRGGDYETQPHGLARAVDVLLLMTSSPLQWQKEHPTRESAERFLEEQRRARLASMDANDMLYQFDASRDYDPSPRLSEIRAPLLAINSADDQVNPPELGILEREIRKVPRGRAVVLPITDRTRGHGTHSLPALWQAHLAALLAESEPGASGPAPAVAGPDARETETQEEAARVEKLEHELVAAIARTDLETYSRIVAEDYAAYDAAGRIIPRAEAIASYRSGKRRYRDLTIHDVTTRVYGDTAVVVARTEGFRLENGREEPNRVRYIRVYARRGGEWKAVAQLAAPEAAAKR